MLALETASIICSVLLLVDYTFTQFPQAGCNLIPASEQGKFIWIKLGTQVLIT